MTNASRSESATAAPARSLAALTSLTCTARRAVRARAGTWTWFLSLTTAVLALAWLAAGPSPTSLLLHAAGMAAQETDTDGDTMPDAWEMFFGFNPNDPSDATGDPDADGLTNAQEFAARRHPVGRHVRYFAEGSTGFFDTSVAVLNLSTTDTAHVALALLSEAGGVVSHQLTLAPRQRQSVSINAVLGVPAAVAIIVESDVPVAADRYMTWGTSGIGASLDSGSPAPATTWYFAEGATGPFLLYYLLQNPGMTPAMVTVRYLIEGGPAVTTTRTLPPQSRTTVFVNGEDPALTVASVGAIVTSDVPIFAERAMYVNAGGTLGGGSASAGSPQLSTQWYFGEGATGPFFHCFLSLLNPGPTPATATVTYHLSDGSTATKAYDVPAEGRRTVYFNGEAALDPALAALANGPVWFTVSSTQPILGERAMWWFHWPWYEGHAAPGNTTSAVSWAVPEGRDGGEDREQTYVLIGNTTTTPGQVRLTLIPDTGAASTQELPIGPGERLTVNIGRLFGLTEARFSVIVDSLGTPAVPLAVDYARYRSVNRVPFSGGGAAPAIPVPPEGPVDTAPSVTSTTPAANATGVAIDANLTVTFSEPVTAGAGAFVLECPTGTPIALVNLTASPATTFTLDPVPDLPLNTACTLRIVASQITDVDTIDPPDTPAADVTVPFTTTACATITVSPTVVPGGTINVDYAPVQFTQTGGTAPVTWSLTAGALPSGMTLSAAGLLAGTPTASGPFTFTVTATDANACTGSVPLSLSILTAPNVAPSFTPGADQTALEDAGPQSVAWAANISPGPAIETGQVVTFQVTGNTNAALFSAAPAISSTGTLTYTPAPNANGTATITVELRDNGGTAGGGVDTSAPASFTIAVTPVNDAPSFTVGPNQTVLEDAGPQTVAGWATAISAGPGEAATQTVAFTVTADTPALFSTQPAVSPTGTLTYTSAPNAFGTATITLVAQDTGGTLNGGVDTSASQSFTISVTPVNDAPTAIPDVGMTTEDTVLTVPAPGVLANDLDPDVGDTRVVVAVNGVPADVGTTITLSGGARLMLNADGSYVLDPTGVAAYEALNEGQLLVAPFTYTLQDSGGLASTAIGAITINGVNDVPTVDLDLDDDGGTPPTTGTGFAITFTEGAPAQFIQDEVDATIADVDSPNLTAITVTVTNVLDALQEKLDVDLATGGFDANFTKNLDESTPGVAVLTITATTPQPLLSFNTLLRRVTYQNLDAGPDASAPRTITFVVNDGVGSSAPATTTVTILSVNDPPTADNDAYSVAEGGTLNVPAPGVLDGDVDPDGDTPITAVLVAGPANATTFTLNPDGSFTYTHNGSETPTTDTFTYQASANGQLSNTATVTITVTAANDAPTAVADANTTTEDAPVTAAAPGVLANDTDPEGGALTVGTVNGLPANVGVATATARGATVTLNANGSYTYTPGSVFQSLRAGQTDTDTFTYTAQDSAVAQSAPATVTITITGVNDAPAGTDASVTINEDATQVFTVANFGFTDPVDTPDDALLAVRMATLPAVGTLTLSGAAVTAGQSIPVANITAGNLVFTPALNGSGTPYASFTFQVQDNGGTANGGVDLDPSANTLTVNVTAVNDAPAGTNSAVTTPEDVALALTIANFGFTDPTDTPANTLQSVLITTLPAAGSLTLSGVGVTAGAEIPAASITAGSLVFTPAANASGSPYTTFTFQVRDTGGTANGGVDLDPTPNTLTVNVTARNDAPAGTNTTVTTNEDTQLTLAAANFGFTDPNDTPANALQSVVITTLPAAGSLTLSGAGFAAGTEITVATITAGNLRFQPALNAFGSPYTTFTFQVRDNGGTANGGVDLDPTPNAMTVNVLPVNDAPTVLPETFDVLGNTELRVDMTPVTPSPPHTTETTPNPNTVEGVLDNDGDVEGDPFAVTAITGCADATAPFDCTLADGAVVHVEANGEFSYTPGPGDAVGSFTYTVTDTPVVGVAASVNGTVTFTFFDMIWYVDADAAAGGNGTSRLPFNTFTAATLSGANGAGDLDDADDYIFVHSATAAINAGIELEAGQHLIGEPVGLSIPRNLNGNGSPTVLVPANAGAPPVINGGAGNSVTVTEAMPAEIRGLTLGSLNAIDVTTDAALPAAATLTIANNVINGATAEGIDVNLNAGTTGTLVLAITGNSWNPAGTHTGNAVDIARAAGTVHVNFSGNTNVLSTGGNGVVINGGAAANTFVTGFASNSIHGNTAGAGVSIANATFDATPGGAADTVNAGALTVGTSINAVGGAGLVLSPVAGSLSFFDLDVFASTSGLSAAGLNLTVTPGVSTISAANGVGVDFSTGLLDLRLSSLTVTTTAAGVSLNGLTAGSQFSAAAGSITKSSGAGTAFSVASSNVAVTYAGSLNVTSGAGVSLTSNNAAATFTFNGGMTLNTGANAAFTATGGGTVTVCDENPCNPAATGTLVNTLTTTTATALNVANTTIGANNLEFRSISSSGGSSTGIIADNTGSSGGLKVKGTGIAGSGGTISSKTGADGSTTTGVGVYLNNTANVSLDRMLLSNFDNNAIRGLSVTAFRLTNSTISGTSGTTSANHDGAITFGTSNPGGANGLFGITTSASLIDNVDVSGAIEHTIEVYNQSGSFGLTISNSNIHDNTVASGSDGILIETQGTTAATINIATNSFSNLKSQGIQVAANDDSAVNLTITGNTVTRGTQGNEGIVLSSGSNGDLTTRVSNNTISGFGGVAIFVGQTAGNATTSSLLHATISGNTVTSPTTATNHSILAFLTSTLGQVSQARLLIDNNTVTQNSNGGLAGIFVSTPDANRTPEFHATVTNNNVDITDAVNGLRGIIVQATRGTGHFAVSGNDVDYPNGIPGGVVGLRVRQAVIDSSPVVVELARGGSASNDPAVVLAANNPNANGVEILGTVTVINNGIVLPPATPPLPLSAGAGGIDPHSATPADPLTASQLETMFSSVLTRMANAGLAADQLARLERIRIELADVEDGHLSTYADDRIAVDSDAAGFGWFVDPTPLDDDEFPITSGIERRAERSGVPAGRYDLLTALMHEMNHVLGRTDLPTELDATDVMAATLPRGVRRTLPKTR